MIKGAKQKVAEKAVRVLVVDDHPTVRQGLRYRIDVEPDMEVCGEAESAAEALQAYDELNPDVVVVDMSLRESSGLQLIEQLRAKHKHPRTLVHSMYDESVYADRCLQAGAMGYVNKETNPDEVIRAIRDIMAGHIALSDAMTNKILGHAVGGGERSIDPVSTLTNRQLEVFRMFGEGKPASEVAKRLHISVHTVETHRDNIKQKLQVKSLPELNRRAVLWVAENH